MNVIRFACEDENAISNPVVDVLSTFRSNYNFKSLNFMSRECSEKPTLKLLDDLV